MKSGMRENILVCIFFVAVFINFLGPITDADFPFHLKAGEYIYQQREIPSDDPFSFYGEGIITDRERFILSQYWLAQVIFYKLYSVLGPPGVILLRATVFTLFVFLLWLVLKKRGLYSSLIISGLVAIILQEYKLDRPQFFSFLFTLVLILLIEKFREKPDSAVSLYFIPPLMLLWVNMHGGFVFGIVVIMLYVVSEVAKLFINKPALIGQPLEKKAVLTFLAISLTTILFSYINPDINGQILITLESHTSERWFFKSIKEYMSPVEAMSRFSAGIPIISFWVIFGFVIIIIVLEILRTKSVKITDFVLIFFSSMAAITAVRYIPFFLAVSLPLSKDYRFFKDAHPFKKIRSYTIAFALFLIFFLLAINLGLRDCRNMFKLGRISDYPEGVAQFLLHNRMEANMFNRHNRGSYLLWRLYPHYKVFNDTRFIDLKTVIDTDRISYALDDYKQPANSALRAALNDTIPRGIGKINVQYRDIGYQETNKPLWKKLLDRYNIGLIVHEACTDYSWEIYPLTLRLLKDDDWVLIYLDGTMLIFVRNKEKYADIIKGFKKPKELIYDEIILETVPVVSKGVPISSPYSSLAFALMMKGKDDDAKKMIDAALELDKKDVVANFCDRYLSLKQNR